MGRRGENIRKRKDGRWEARVITSYDASNRAKYRSVYGKTYTEVKAKRNTLLENRLRENERPAKGCGQYSKITFEQVCYEWLDEKRMEIKESSYAHYVHIIRKHLLPELGDCCYASVTSDMVNELLQMKLKSGDSENKNGLSPKTVADIRSVLIQITDFAKSRKYLSGIGEKIFSPKMYPPVIQILDREEQKKLEKYIFEEPTPFSTGILLALYGGLRIGEICSLKWGDIYLENNLIQIDKTLLRIQETDYTPGCSNKTKILIDKPKTSNSIRIIPLPEFIIKHLQTMKQGPDIYVITGTACFMEPRTCLDKYKKVLKTTGISDYTFHALRHTFATRCVEMGFDIKSLSEILGHANINVTLQRYVHPSMEMKRKQMNLLKPL